jgi:putative SOS response-associated peptidase YedK
MHPRFELHADVQSLAAWADLPNVSIHVPQTTSSDGRIKLHPVLRASGQDGRAIAWMREGLIPSYACDDHDAVKRAEAHAEAMTCDSCFRSAFRRRRCIVPAHIIHEVRHLSAGIVHPCSFSLESGEMFGIAAVWETWINDEEHTIESFAIVTTLVTPLLRSLFERMPVILQSHDEQERWLSHEQPEAGPLDLLKPLSPCQLRGWKMKPEAVAVRISQSGEAVA